MAEGNKWVVVLEATVQGIESKPLVAYTIVHKWPLFNTFDEAMAFHKEKKLPLGWVIATQSQLHMQ